MISAILIFIFCVNTFHSVITTPVQSQSDESSFGLSSSLHRSGVGPRHVGSSFNAQHQGASHIQSQSQFVGESTLNKDTIEGETIVLDCRFDPSQLGNSKLIFYWHRTNHKKTEPVALNETPLSNDYKIEYSPIDGRYDLTIHKAQYDRDNGMFECKLKEVGSGTEIKSVSYIVTILISPGPPLITPQNPVAREGEPFELTCSSHGGSPDPVIQWFRNNQPQQGQITMGGTKDIPTSSTLVIDPKLELDNAIYRCTVWNRALPAEKKLESSVSLTVHYKPRVTVGPFNPLNVLVDGNAEMTCLVEANPPVRSVRWMKNGALLTNTNNHTILRVKPDDSGKYDCVADNGVGGSNGQPGKDTLELSVLYGPRVNVLPQREATIDDSLSVKCNVNSNPKPHSVIWLKTGDTSFRQTGDVLVLNRIQAEDSGEYICVATNTLKPSGSGSLSFDKTANATVEIKVKHKPGESWISPENPIAIAGKPFTLTCQSKPPGYPEPNYKWWREGQEGQELGHEKTYKLIAVHVSHEGRYFCQAFNSLGKGSEGSVYLTVNEPPTMVIPLKPHYIGKEGDKNFKLTCISRGKPKLSVTWWQNGQEITTDNGQFRIEKRETIEDANVHVIQTTLHFEGISRHGTNSLSSQDRGRYVCVFDNGIGTGTRSETLLRIEHSPIVRHSYNRVAFDPGETAVIQCKMSAYPTPKFEWYFNNKLLDNNYYGLGDRYSTNTTELPDDIHVSTLSIRSIKESDYGDYRCRSWNSVGDDSVGQKTNIQLVKKSPPEMPTQLEVIEVLSDSVTLRWYEEFNGGFSNTEFIVTYSDGMGRWRNESCKTMNPCKITGLESRHEYSFRVLAVNPRGYSPYSDEIKVTTKVNLKDMPSAFESSFDRERNTLYFRVDQQDVQLKLVAKIEILTDISPNEWRQLTSVNIISDYEKVLLRSIPEEITDIRIVLCLQSNDSWCGYEHLVKMDSIYARESKNLSTEHLMSVILISGFCAFGAVAMLLCCCWRKKDKLMTGDDDDKKDYDQTDSDSGRNMNLNHKVTTISQPYYTGHDNKAGLINGINGLDGINSKISPPLYSGSNEPLTGGLNGHHIAQNYYLTDPSPNGSNETAQSELWKSDLMHDGMIGDNGLSHSYGVSHSAYGINGINPHHQQHQHQHQIDPHQNGYYGLGATYSYYPHDDYNPLTEDMNRKNNMHAQYYDDGTGTMYGTSIGMGLISEQQPSSLQQVHNVINDNSYSIHQSNSDSHSINQKLGHSYSTEENEYSTNRNGRVIREIIV